jgi:hypothetical protein
MIIAVLVSFVVYLLNFVNLYGLASLILLLTGLWTVVSAFVIFERKHRSFYSGWGIVMAALSLSYFVSPNYTVALVLLAIVTLIIINVYFGKAPKMLSVATGSPAPAGDTPASLPS